ncbi:methyltransferase family protein [Amycolatopsis thermoflava]|uniref:methyltransferase family protein n=1 Tax=Amycolatopsis thermoflava TaxID=84480 RepID=UPI0038110C0D
MDDRALGGIALAVMVAFLALAFGLRALVHRRRTGTTGFHGVSGRPGSVEWWGGVSFVLALVLGLVAPAAQFAGAVAPPGWLGSPVVTIAGGVLALVGMVLTLAAQRAMGSSWRVGVAAGEATDLVTSGPFALVRNPVFTAMITAAAGLVLLAANIVAFVSLVLLVLAVQLQVRLVEEPHLRATQGQSYLAYAARVGRFLPGVGRLRPDRTDNTATRKV